MGPKPDSVSQKEVTALRTLEERKKAELQVFQDKAAQGDGNPKKPRSPVNARLNEENFPVTEAVAVRFTILAARRSPA